MRKPQNKFEIFERDTFYYLQRNGKEQLCPENFEKRVNCGSWCPFFAIRLEEFNGNYYYMITLLCRLMGATFKITNDIILNDNEKAL